MAIFCLLSRPCRRQLDLLTCLFRTKIAVSKCCQGKVINLRRVRNLSDQLSKLIFQKEPDVLNAPYRVNVLLKKVSRVVLSIARLTVEELQAMLVFPLDHDASFKQCSFVQSKS